MSATSDRDVDYLVRRFTLEKGFAVVGEEGDGGELVVRSLDPSRFGYDLPIIRVPEIEPLEEHVDALLVRADGGAFIAIGIRKHDGQGVTGTLSRDTLLDVGSACLPYTGKVSGTKMPVHLDVIEVHRNEPRPEDVERLDALRHTHTTEKNVIVSAYSVGFRTGTVRAQTGRWTLAAGRARYLRRILKEADEPEHRMVERVRNARRSVPRILGGIAVGLVVALAARFLLATLGVENGQFYGAADYVGDFAAVGVAVFARRIRAESAIQATSAAGGYSLLLYGSLVFVFGAPFSLWMVLNTVVFTLSGFYIGVESEMA